MGKSGRALKIGSDNIDLFSLYGTALRACQGADFFDWYREEGLSVPGAEFRGLTPYRGKYITTSLS
jgi:hypothetical protein